MIKWAALVGAILTEVTATLCLRASLEHPVWVVGVVIGYLAAFGLLVVVLRHGMPIGVAYGIWGAGGVALTAIAAFVIFGEPLTWLMGLGIVIVVAGVLLVEIGSQRAQAAAAAAAASAAAAAAPREGETS
ncbi:DMT family transporter [Herbiconiux solani]|uniref:DMT family transporter n=1 Tax=Herbiconiux solani TaxID=661329 RepID=UPI000825D65A|nr:SMR family transporter [Herbiconiux solani]